MSKSLGAKVTSDMLELFSLYMDKNGQKLIDNALRSGEKPSPAPLVPKTRFEDSANGRVFYANENSGSGITVFYIHGGAYFMDFARSHWKLMNTLVKEADAQVIAPAYRRVPFFVRQTAAYPFSRFTAAYIP